mmetsp:Transcript_5858/g.11826  ORF Transcript_5858/g.11826 Transcript_5858/m.11826 type:complete len:200 (+) Transcript_5858:414-1013(+)
MHTDHEHEERIRVGHPRDPAPYRLRLHHVARNDVEEVDVTELRAGLDDGQEYEGTVVPATNGRIQPPTEVVELFDASLGVGAVLCAGPLQNPGRGAKSREVRDLSARGQCAHDVLNTRNALQSRWHLARVHPADGEKEGERDGDAELKGQRNHRRIPPSNGPDVAEILEDREGHADKPESAWPIVPHPRLELGSLLALV